MAGTQLRGQKAVEWYHRYVGQPESRRDVWGYWLFLLGSLCGLLGIVIFQVEQALLGQDLAVREVAIVLAAVGLTVGLFGIVVLLPVRRSGMFASIVGMGIAFAGIGLFTWAYPSMWYVEPDYSPEIIGLYAIGITVIAGVAILVPIVTGERALLVEPELGIGSDEPPVLLGDAKQDAFYSIYQTPSNEWTWRVIQRDAIAESLYQSRSDTDAKLHIEELREKIGRAGLLEITTAAFRIYRTEDDHWRWTLARDNGTVVAKSSSLYENRDGVETAATFCKEQIPAAGEIEILGAAFDIYEDDAERWRWRLVDGTRTPLAASTGRFTQESVAESDSRSFAQMVADARVLGVDTIATELYEEDDGWRWRIVDAHGRPLATSERSFNARRGAESDAHEVTGALEGATVIQHGEPGYELVKVDNTWEWRLRSNADEMITVSTDRSESREAVEAAAERTRGVIGDADVVEFTGLDYEVYTTDGAFHWRLVTEDRQVLASSAEDFPTRAAAVEAAEGVHDHAREADLIEFEQAAFQQYEFEGEWRWRLIDKDGQVMADSGEAYDSQEAVQEGMLTLKEHAPDAQVLEIDTAAFELYRTEDGGHAWRLIDEGGALVAAGAETYDSRAAARQAVDFLLDHLGDADVRPMEDAVFHVRAVDEDWTYSLVHPDGTLLAEAIEPLATRDDALGAVEEARVAGGDASIQATWPSCVQIYDEGDVHWRVIDPERSVIAHGERTYPTRTDAMADLDLIIEGATEAPVFTFEKGVIWVAEEDDGWRWRLLNEEREPIAENPAPVKDKSDARWEVDEVRSLARDAGYFDIDVCAFEVYQDDDGWHWRLLDADEHVLAESDVAYPHREDLEAAIADLRDLTPQASILDIEEVAFEFHEREGRWLWRLVDEHGEPMAESVEAHPSRQEARKEMLIVKEYAPDGQITIAY